MVAAGTRAGELIIFKLPSSGHEFQLFIVEDMHEGPVTAVIWSSSAEKLFSADTSGAVTCTYVSYDQVC